METIVKRAEKILKRGYVCDSCLGRQFGQLLSGFTNKERGGAIRSFLALSLDSGQKLDINMSNFYGIKFRKAKIRQRQKKPEKCIICDGLLDNLDKWADEAVKRLKQMEFRTFLVGVKMNDDLVIKEESLWESVGLDWSESIKSEISRELGKLIYSKIKKEVDEAKPEVVVIINLIKNRIDLEIKSLFIYGRYNKLVRGIPQTKWDKYEETVEDIIAKPIMKTTKGSEHALHATGREDIDARCLAWRPFVFEVKNPTKRKIDLKKIQKEVNKTGKVEIKDLKFSDKKEVIEVKSAAPDKIYRVLVSFEKPVENIEEIRKIIGVCRQKTPRRVLHRRADKLRLKKVKDIKWKRINNNKFELEIHGEAGLYIKELVTGDNGRTKPSVYEILKNPAKVEELDVIKIFKK